MDLAIGPFLAAVLLLAHSGVSKLTRPEPARAAMRALHLPHSRLSVRVLGAFEVAVAIAGVVAGTAGAVAVAVAYLALSVVAFVLWRAAPSTPCGCLGASPTPATGIHVAVNFACVVVAVLATSAPHAFTVVADQPLAGVPFLLLVVCVAALAALTIDAWPRLRAEIRDRST